MCDFLRLNLLLFDLRFSTFGWNFLSFGSDAFAKYLKMHLCVLNFVKCDIVRVSPNQIIIIIIIIIKPKRDIPLFT